MAVPAAGQVYPVIFIDALMVKFRDGVVASGPVYLVIGMTATAPRGLGLGTGPSRGAAKF